MSIISRILGSIEARCNQPQLSIWRTIYINFRTLPFNVARKLPIYIYGKHRLFMLNGTIEIIGPLRKGMIKIGVNGDSFSLFDHTGYIQLSSTKSKIIFNGPCRIALNTKIRIIGDGLLDLGSHVRIGSNARIICNGGRIKNGKCTGVTFDCQLMNSSFHFTYNLSKLTYNNRTLDIIIGNYNWIGNHTIISQGVKTSDYTIVAQGSLLTKDYSTTLPNSLLAGIPATVKGLGIKRIFSPHTEKMVQSLFGNQNVKAIKSEEFNDSPEDIIVEM